MAVMTVEEITKYLAMRKPEPGEPNTNQDLEFHKWYFSAFSAEWNRLLQLAPNERGDDWQDCKNLCVKMLAEMEETIERMTRVLQA